MTATPAPLVQLTGVHKSYFSGRVETPVLHGIDFTMQQGDFVAIMGQSGSGKSTLMNILGCLDTPTAGEHRLAGFSRNPTRGWRSGRWCTWGCYISI